MVTERLQAKKLRLHNQAPEQHLMRQILVQATILPMLLR